MSEADSKKLSKKQLKALEFRNKKKGNQDADLTVDKSEEPAPKAESRKRKAASDTKVEQTGDDSYAPDGSAAPVSKDSNGTKKKRRKTKAADDKDATGAKKPSNRFIIFIGNLPYDCTVEDVQQHFKASKPAAIRLRKGFAFAEFDGLDATKKLNVALRLHHTSLKDRKINVELTAGGGGNSDARKKKLQEKNQQLQVERSERIAEEEKALKNKKVSNGEATEGPAPAIHPSRAKLMDN